MRRCTGVKGMFSCVINAVSQFGLLFTVSFEYDCLPIFQLKCLSGQVYDIHLCKPLIRQNILASNMSLNYLDSG